MTEKLCLLSWGEPEDVKLCLVWVNSLKVLSLSKISKSQHLSESAVCVQLAVWGGSYRVAGQVRCSGQFSAMGHHPYTCRKKSLTLPKR